MDIALRKPRDSTCLNHSTYFVGQREEIIMYLLDLCVSCSTYLMIFMAHEGSREALNFCRITSEITSYLHRYHKYLITTEKEIATKHLTYLHTQQTVVRIHNSGTTTTTVTGSITANSTSHFSNRLSFTEVGYITVVG